MVGHRVDDGRGHESRCSRRVTMRGDLSLPVLDCPCRFGHLGNKVASIGREDGESCQRALQVQHITLPQCRVPPTAMGRRQRKRVCVYWRGVAKRLCPRRAYLTVLAKSSARADSAPTPAVRVGAYRHNWQIKYVPFPTICALPASRRRDPINQVCITEIIDFYLPTLESNSHPK